MYLLFLCGSNPFGISDPLPKVPEAKKLNKEDAGIKTCPFLKT
jgi:hypothetical protein